MSQSENELTYQTAKALKSAIYQNGLNQTQLAERLGVSTGVVSKLLSGRHSPTLRTLAKTADAAGLEVQIEFVRPPAPDIHAHILPQDPAEWLAALS